MSRRAPRFRVVGMTQDNTAARRIGTLALVALWIVLAAPPTAGFAQPPAAGISSVRAQVFGNEDLGSYQPLSGDLFGSSFATGDFNGDGIDDLATGIPWDDGLTGDPLSDCGIVVVRYGIAGRGLAGGLASTVLSQHAAGGQNPAEAGDNFGYALAAGDFNGDGIDDLAVGVPGEALPYYDDPSVETVGAGLVQIHYGLPGGLELVAEHTLAEIWTDEQLGTNSDAQFGAALAAGDFNGDGYADLAAGSPGQFASDGQSFVRSGIVKIFLGDAGGLLPAETIWLNQNSPGMNDFPQPGDQFGSALAAGNFNGDGHVLGSGFVPYDDLAIGVPGEEGMGAVQVLFGKASLVPPFDANGIWLQGEIGDGGVSEAGDHFGASLAVGDFDADGLDDLAIGAPDEDLGASNQFANAGAVGVIYGAPDGAADYFDWAKTDQMDQSTFFGAAANESLDYFGWALAAGDFDRDGRSDLAIGIPQEDLTGSDEGGVTVTLGGPTGVGESAFRFVSAGFNGIPGVTQSHREFGRALATGDFDGNGHADLAIGVPYFNPTVSLVDAGQEVVLYGSLFADGFEGSSTLYWTPGP